MTDLQGRIFIGMVVVITLTIRFILDHFYPHLGSREDSQKERWKHSLKNVAILATALLLGAQILGFDILRIDLSESVASSVRITGNILGTFAGVMMTWPRIMPARLRAWSGPITNPCSIEGHRLVTRGPYKYVRHPFYMGMISGVIAIEMVVTSYLVIFLAALMFCVQSYIVRREEAQLEADYGDEHRTYVKQAPWRFIPFIY